MIIQNTRSDIISSTVKHDNFKNRKKELSELNNVLSSNKFEFIIIYGRRRIGKTELVLKATEKNNRIYYLAVGANNLERFYKLCSMHFPEILKLTMDWEIIFEFLKDNVEVVVIDEFQNMIRENANNLNIFQSIMDITLKESDLKIILLGSSISIMTSRVLDYQSPLYGRRTGSLELKAVSFFDLKYFFGDCTPEELIEIYGFADGIPFYLIKIVDHFWLWLSNELMSKMSFLKDEVDFLMRYEFENVTTYKSILEAIAHGSTKLNDIKDHMNVRRTDISPYLRNLIKVGMVSRIAPVTEKPNSRLGRYYICDNFLKFWFRFIYPNVSSIEEGIMDIDIIKTNYNQYLGGVFEDVCMQFINKHRKKTFNFTKIGKWWYKENEIDIVAFNHITNEILFIECKWQELTQKRAKKILSELKKKSAYVQWNNGVRKEYYGIMGKKIETKKELIDMGFCVFDLEDIGKA